MKGNVFSKWLQEFCSLVFVQTIQAFVLAMIMTIIVTAMTNGKSGGSLGDSEIIYSTGVLAIIALASISKVELLVKKIFGLEGGLGDKASMREGRGGILGTVMGLKLAKRALDNVPKMASGGYSRFKAGQEERQTKLNYANKLNKLDQRYGSAGVGTGGGAAGATGGSGANAGAGASAGGVGASAAAAATSAGAATGNIANKIAYEEKRDKMLEDYNAKIMEIQAKKRAATRKAFSGAAETAFGLSGAVAGMAGKAIVDGASGEASIKGVLEAGGIGLGIGDTIGNKMVEVTGSVNDIAREQKQIRKTVRQYKSRKTEIDNLLNNTKVDAGSFD